MKSILAIIVVVACKAMIAHASLPALAGQFYPRPLEITYQYDSLSRLTKKEARALSGARTVTDHAYDPVGNMLSASDDGSKVEFAYDALNRPVKTEQTFGGGSYTIFYAYDAVGNRTSMTTPWGEYTYTYDALNRLTAIVNPQGITIAFGYDAVGRRTKKTIFKTLPETLAETDYTYDKAGQLLSIINRSGGKAISFARYEYDAAGNMILKEDQSDTINYAYDLANRLILASGTATSETFAYDDSGNRLSDEEAKDYAYDAANRIQANSLYTFTHDLNGNLTARTARNDGATITYVYNPKQQLSKVITPEHSVQYKYDPLGRRIEKIVDGNVQRYVYDNEDIIAVLDGGNALLRTFTHGPGIDEPLIMTGADGGSYYYHADALGSITALTDDKGETAQTIKYQSYGKPVIVLYDQAAAGNPYYFTAREYDAETSLYYYRARYYDWRRGAFTQEDPIGLKGGTNAYIYTHGSPLNFTDPSGEIAAAVVLGGVMGGVFGGVSTALGDYAANGSVSMVNIGKGIAVGIVAGAMLPVVTMEIALSGVTIAGSSVLAQYTGAAILGGVANVAQYSLTATDLSLGNLAKAGGLGLVAGAIGGPFRGTLGMQDVPWQILAQKNAGSYGLRALGTGFTEAYTTNRLDSCPKGARE